MLSGALSTEYRIAAPKAWSRRPRHAVGRLEQPPVASRFEHGQFISAEQSHSQNGMPACQQHECALRVMQEYARIDRDDPLARSAKTLTGWQGGADRGPRSYLAQRHGLVAPASIAYTRLEALMFA